jgi:DNA-binding transcriptional MerR regulator
MAKRRKAESMGAAECARHTGLTVRALRVYEKQGLIAPARSAKGWRRYGQKDLTRLSIIVTLKVMGLSLAQIREALTAEAPSLARVLQMQRRVWETRKDAAAKSLAMVDAALGHLRARKALSIDELCELIRSVGMNGSWQGAARDLINEMVAPDEERAWLTYLARRPKEEGQRSRELLEAQIALMRDVRVLMERGAAPGDAAVQKLVDQSNRNWLHYKLRERALEDLSWNATLAKKLFAVGNRLILQTATTGATPESAAGVSKFFTAAILASKWNRALEQLIADVRAERPRSEPSSAAAQKLAARFATICERHSLGDPVVYARWAAAAGRPLYENERIILGEPRKTLWLFLAEAADAYAKAKRAH